MLAMDLPALAADKEGVETGKRLYLTYCMQCHGADAHGGKGFPNLADNDWQWGGEPAQIVETISNGRMGVMPAHAQLGAETIKDLANYVRSLSGLPADSLRAAKGQEAFNSVGCSGADAGGGSVAAASDVGTRASRSTAQSVGALRVSTMPNAAATSGEMASSRERRDGGPGVGGAGSAASALPTG